jgi:hypothetical protein
MTVSADDLLLVKLKLTGCDGFSDDEITAVIELSPVKDADGYKPTDDDWTPTYDLNKSASDLWLMQASKWSDEFDFNADGASYTRNQKYEHALTQSRYYMSRSKPSVITLINDD